MGKIEVTKKTRSKKGASFDGETLDFGKDPSVVQQGCKITLTRIALTEAEKKMLLDKFPSAGINVGGAERPTVLIFKSKKEALRCYALMESDDSPFPSTLQVGTCYSCDDMILE